MSTKKSSPNLLLPLASFVVLVASLITILSFSQKPAVVPQVEAASTGTSSTMVTTSAGKFKITLMSFDLNSVKMITDSADDSDCANNCKTMSLKDFVSKNGGFAGVNGTYFCPASYPDCAPKKDSYDFPIYNSRLHKWINSNNLGWGSRALLYTTPGSAQYRQDSRNHPSDAEAAIINYPGIISDGNVQIDENQSGLSAKQKSKGTKIAIGTTGGSNVSVVAAYNVNMYEFGLVLKAIGIKGAVNLDTGGSSAMISGGKYLLGPGRNIPNAVVFVRR